MTELNGVRLPVGYNGLGAHDTVGCYLGPNSKDEARVHAQELLAHGIHLYKLFGSGTNKVTRADEYIKAGVLPIFRDWKEKPWGRPPASWVMPVDQIRPYADVGMQLFEIAGNEFNISDEWNIPMPNKAAVIAVAAVNAFEVALNACAQVPGTYPLFSSATPGGNVDHRVCYEAILTELTNRGLLSSVKHVAIHNRPHNNPPETKWSATNTVTFDEFRWIRDCLGADKYYWATEHGYSLKDDQNHNYPQIDLTLHTEYNWTLDLWMNPAHAKAIDPQLAGFCHWFEAGWGAWGAWPKDALRDSIVPEMPAPSPLWIRMGEWHDQLEFNRYGYVPPVVDYAKGFDCSSYQGDINWDAVSEDYSFVFIRASAGLTPDTKYNQNYDASGERGMLRGAYHYLRQELDGQARLFYETCVNKKPELGWYADIEQAELTADKCQLFLTTLDGFTEESTGIYTRASFFDKFGTPSWTQGRKLWVAHWGGVEEPTLPQAWSDWEFWQTGQGPVAGQTMDLNVYNGDEESLYDNYGEEPPVEDNVKIYDSTGEEKDWDWLKAKYGVGNVIDTPITDSYWKIEEIREQADGANVCFITVAPGTPVISYYTTAPNLDQMYNREWHDNGDVSISDVSGQASFGMYSNYFPDQDPFRGPYEVWCGIAGQHSEKLYIGMPAGTNHHHLRPKYVWYEGDEPPPDNDQLDRIEEQVDAIWLLVNHIHDQHVFQPDNS